MTRRAKEKPLTSSASNEDGIRRNFWALKPVTLPPKTLKAYNWPSCRLSPSDSSPPLLQLPRINITCQQDKKSSPWRCGARSTSQGWNGLRGLRLADLRHLVSEKRNGWVAYRFLRAMQEGQPLFATSWRKHRKASGGQIDVGRWQQSVYRDAVSRVTAEGSSAYGSDSATPLTNSKDLRTTLRDMFRNAQWISRFTFKENDFQQSLELECRDIRPCLRFQPTVALMSPPDRQSNLPHCRLNNGCPVAPLNTVAWPWMRISDRSPWARWMMQTFCRPWCASTTWSCQMKRQCSKTIQPPRPCEWRDPLIAFCRMRTHLLSEWNFAWRKTLHR